MPETIDAARDYVGTTPLSGLAQLLLLLRVGLRPGDSVLEIGCGALHLAEPLLAYQGNVGAYAGIDPNVWLRDAARDADPMLNGQIAEGNVWLSSADDFYAADLAGPERYNVVFSHSVLSHASHGQVAPFLSAVSRRLTANGVGLVSLNFSGRSGFGSATDEWTYPDAVELDRVEVFAAADAAELRCLEGVWLRALYTSFCPTEIHDWLVLRPAAARGPRADA